VKQLADVFAILIKRSITIINYTASAKMQIVYEILFIIFLFIRAARLLRVT